MSTTLISMHFQSESGAVSLMEQVTEAFKVYRAHCKDASTVVYYKDGTVTLTFLKTLASRSGESSLFWHALSNAHFPGKQVQGLPPAPSQLPILHIDTLFMQALGRELQPGTSSLMLIVRDDWSQRVMKVLGGYRGQIYYTSLSPEDTILFADPDV